MKKKLLSMICLSLLTATSVAAVITSTVAWFDTRTSLDLSDVIGSSQGAYFGGGDGSDGDPYVINNKNHVYNLAWLQYLGYFDGSTEPTTTIRAKQPYFIVKADIDMEGMVLPPIGTTRYPFLGHFDGNKKVISNLTTSNNLSTFGRKPTRVNSLSDVAIVGFFGVVGDYSGAQTTSSTTPDIKDIGLEDITVETTTGSHLVGLGAGYVNGQVSGVAIGNAEFDIPSGTTAITSITSNLSDYSLVGYCTDDYKTTTDVVGVTASTPTIANGNASNSGNVFGASIPMSDIFDNLYKHSHGNTYSFSPTTYVSAETRYYDANGDLKDGSPVTTGTSPYTVTNSNTTYNYLTSTDTDSNGTEIASYDIAVASEYYMYLYGAEEKTISNGLSVTSVYDHNGFDSQGGFVIQCNDNFLAYNSTASIKNSKTRDTTDVAWHNDNSNHLYVIRDNVKYYLTATRSGNGNNATYSLSLSTTASSAWAYNTTYNTYTTTVSGTTVYLVCNGGTWGLSTSVPTYYYLRNGSNYLSASGTTIVNQTSEATATKWSIDSSGRYYITIDSTDYYLSYVNGSIGLSTSTSTALTMSSNNYLRYRYSNYYTYYAYLTGGVWTLSTRYQTSITATTLRTAEIYTADTSGTYTTSEITTEDAKFRMAATYFPLKFNDDHTDIADNNTGYIVSGGKAAAAGDVRVSKYTNSHSYGLDYSYNWTGNGHASYEAYYDRLEILTRCAASNGDYRRISDAYNGSNTNVSTRISGYTKSTVKDLGLKKYTLARKYFHDWMMDAGTDLYGLHFMNAQISSSETIELEKAKAMGVTYRDGLAFHQVPTLDAEGKEQKDTQGNVITHEEQMAGVAGKYELPADCIDFGLSENGTINFFAGSYFNNVNDAFFSLHQIVRNPNTLEITEINEIRQVYENTAYDAILNNTVPRYVYYLKSESGAYFYTAGTKGNLLFDLSWITDDANIISNNLNECCFYFEIPVMAGEYALGSVKDLDGAYLMYLDIGASDENNDIVIVTESVLKRTDRYEFPIGIDFAVLLVSSTPTYVVTAGGESATVKLSASTTGPITYTPATNQLTCGPPSGVTLQSTYVADNFALLSGASVLTPTPIFWEQSTIDSTTKVTYDIDNTRTVYEKTETTTTTRSDGTTPTNNGQEVIYDPVIEPLTEEDYENIKLKVLTPESGEVYCTLHYAVPYGGTVNFTYRIQYDATTEKYTYAFTFTSSVAITIYVDSVLQGYLLSINGTAVTAGGSVQISAS